MKEIYITDSEREKCRKVADAFAELYEIEHILVVDAGRYGFVKLQYYRNLFYRYHILIFHLLYQLCNLMLRW